MKRVYEFITKSNQVMWFFVAVAVVALIAREIIGDMIRPRRETSVPIATNGDARASTPVKDVRLSGVWFDWYIFEVAKEEVGPRGTEGVLAMKVAVSSFDDYSNKTIVNIVFSDGDSRVRFLLPADGLVLDRRMSSVNERDRQTLQWHAFRCVTEDTNQDRKLDARDRNDLYLVSRDPSRADVILKGVDHHREISASEIAYSTGEGEAKRFWKLDLESSETTELPWRLADQ